MSARAYFFVFGPMEEKLSALIQLEGCFQKYDIWVWVPASLLWEFGFRSLNSIVGLCWLYSEWVTPASLLHPLLLPKIYPPLFNLYALYNEKDDDRYWKRIRLWNKQSNLALMSYLGVDK